MKLRNLRLTHATVNVTASRRDFEVVDTSVNRVRSDDGTVSRDIDCYCLHCLANRGDVLKVKVPKECAQKVTDISDQLRDDKTVNVTFEGLKLTAYAMPSSNPDYPVNSGVVGRALDFTYTTSTEEDNFSDIEI